MGKSTGFLDIHQELSSAIAPKERCKNFNEFHIPLPLEKQQCQGARCMDCGVPFCQYGQNVTGSIVGCPINNLIPEWNELLYRGNLKEAAMRLLKTNNFPEFTSRVCPALCQGSCTNGLYGDPVTIKENEHRIIEEAFEHGWVEATPPTTRNNIKVAVVGSGPAGLTVADELNKQGYSVTVFERDDRIGGLLMYGIPNMKIEKNIIQRRVSIMEQQGIIFKTNSGIENKQQATKLLQDFDKVVLACGSRQPRSIQVPNNDASGIYYAVDYLTSVTKALLDQDMESNAAYETKGKDVLIIGGGDTGNDCVATAIRLGCKSVTQLEMMPELPTTRSEDNPWPTWPRVKKVDYGQEECIAFFDHDPRIYQTTVKEFKKDARGKVIGAILVSLELNSETKRFEEVAGSQREVAADLVLIAAGFVGSQQHVADAFGVELDARGNVIQDNYATSVKNLYVAGDMKMGQSLVVWAIKEGRAVAQVIMQETK